MLGLKKQVVVLLIIAAAFTAKKAHAQDRQEKILRLAERNLALTLGGQNETLKESALQVLIELERGYPQTHFEETLTPLTLILRNHPNAGIRILAAMALRDLHAAHAIDAVVEASEIDENVTVREICGFISRGNK